MSLKAGIWAARLDLGLEVGIWVNRLRFLANGLGFGSSGTGMGQQGGIWNRLGFGLWGGDLGGGATDRQTGEQTDSTFLCS